VCTAAVKIIGIRNIFYKIINITTKYLIVQLNFQKKMYSNKLFILKTNIYLILYSYPKGFPSFSFPFLIF